MADNIVTFPGVDAPSKDENEITPEKVLHAAHDRYDELVLIGRVKGTGKYECVSTIEIPETLFHITRIQHRLNLFLDGNGK